MIFGIQAACRFRFTLALAAWLTPAEPSHPRACTGKKNGIPVFGFHHIFCNQGGSTWKFITPIRHGVAEIN